MENTKRQPIAAAAAGLLLGFLVGVFVAPDPNSLEHSVQITWTYAIIGAVLGGIAFAICGLVANRRVSRVFLVPVIVFASITVVPWFPSKSGHLLPVGTAYVNPGFPWESTLMIHIAITLLITTIVVVLIRARRHFKQRRPTPHARTDPASMPDTASDSLRAAVVSQ